MRVESYSATRHRTSAGGRGEPVDNTEKLRRVRLGQIKRYVRDAVGAKIPETAAGENILRALLATGLTGPQAQQLAPWVAADRLDILISQVDAMMPDEVSAGWLGEMLALSSEDREKHRIFHIWPAGWTEEQVKEQSRARDVERRKLSRHKERTTTMDYGSLTRARPKAVLALIPPDRPISVAELTARTARRREFIDATGKPLSTDSRHRVLHRALDALKAERLIVDAPEYLPNGRPIRRVARVRT